MNLYRAKCNACGETPYIFPDQIEFLKQNKFDSDGKELTMHKYCKDKLSIGSKWFCIKCDASKKNGHDCKIVAELTGKDAKSLIDIRARETNLKEMDFHLPKLY